MGMCYVKEIKTHTQLVELCAAEIEARWMNDTRQSGWWTSGSLMLFNYFIILIQLLIKCGLFI